MQDDRKNAAAAGDTGPEGIEAAWARIRPHVRETPVIEVEAGAFANREPIVLKLELMQHTGSFKPRGAFNNLLSMAVPEAGVVAASGGNHGAAVAYAAMRLGVPANIFVPEIASPVKIARIRAYGAKVHVGGARYADALAASERFIARTGAAAVHAYDQPGTLQGQGTVALEWERQVQDLDSVLVAVGGGGLIGGIAAWLGGRVKLVAVEPETSCALHAALRAGQPVDVEVSGVAADSLGARSVGRLMFPIAQGYVARSVLVSDEAIVEAQRALWERLRVVAEPGGAAALAALLSGAYRPEAGERVGVLLCGGNADLAALVSE